ncbi:hypothetical protein ED733_004451 [Metarhizium rileyi]|uniref:TNT domain-containing protein n=1 Tax=Metarhizium rileyi (strain RCEF 4871) TaxID=1649241 RepID=A0A5C6G8B5_METRR|nr:hypothetical protein ED733_004451 [Metarhizium rileyi]
MATYTKIERPAGKKPEAPVGKAPEEPAGKEPEAPVDTKQETGIPANTSCDAKDFCQGVKAEGSQLLLTCGNRLLGPSELLNKPAYTEDVNRLISNYRPFPVGTCASDFLQRFTDDGGNYKFPVQGGFELDANNEAILKDFILTKDMLVDRFDGEPVGFLSPYGTPLEERAIPPSLLALDPKRPDSTPYNYHKYQVLKDHPVRVGTIAPWLDQPGNGTRIIMGSALDEAIQGGFLVEICTPGTSACGWDDDAQVSTIKTCDSTGRWKVGSRCGDGEWCKLFQYTQIPMCKPKSWSN